MLNVCFVDTKKLINTPLWRPQVARKREKAERCILVRLINGGIVRYLVIDRLHVLKKLIQVTAHHVSKDLSKGQGKKKLAGQEGQDSLNVGNDGQPTNIAERVPTNILYSVVIPIRISRAKEWGRITCSD